HRPSGHARRLNVRLPLWRARSVEGFRRLAKRRNNLVSARPAKKGQVYFGRFYQAKRSNKNAGCKTSVPVGIRRIHGYQLSSS
ncbi:hypothetical protein, partial [Collinsella aerofaciens]|uniref:hypothetical protein n=1 Tax=Collinsella aerofaciens TaxID=74426 RepID=UPI00325AAEAB